MFTLIALITLVLPEKGAKPPAPRWYPAVAAVLDGITFAAGYATALM